MKETEIIKLISIVSANYRNFPEDGKERTVLALWKDMLSDIPFDVALASIRAHIAKSQFPPTIADIRGHATALIQPPSKDAMQAWHEVTLAIRRFGYAREVEAMNSLSPDVAEMVRRFSWRELCLSENVDVIRAQWRKAWETQQKRQEEYKQLPSDVRELIGRAGFQLEDGR